jgi:hypothetical protein
MNVKQSDVQAYLNNLEHPLKDVIITLRGIVLSAQQGITEHIKWNAPSFCYGGEDYVTMKLYPQKNVQLIFHRGATTKSALQARLVEDESGFLKWASNDRAVLTLTDAKDLESKKDWVAGLVREWITKVVELE